MLPPNLQPAITLRLPTPSSAGRSFPQRALQVHSCAPRKAKGTKPAEGLRPWRATRGTPIFRASLVQTSAALRPLHSATAPFQGWEPLLLHLPPLLPGARVCLLTNTARRFKNGGTTTIYSSSSLRQDTSKHQAPTSPRWADSIVTRFQHSGDR